MSIREHRAEVAPEAADDSTLRKLDVAEGRERHLREQVELLEERLLEAEKEISALHREIRVRAELGAEMQRTLSWRESRNPPRDQATPPASVTTTLCFVGARRGNVFMNELLAAVAHEVEEAGMPTELAFDSLPDSDGRAYVLIPHEYYECVRDEHWPTRAQLARTVAFCTEQPGTHWFDLGAMYGRSAGAVVDIYKGSVRVLERKGTRAEHFPLGYTSFWDRWERDESVERPVDVLHLGAGNERRLRALAGYAGTLWPHRTRLLIPPESPKTSEERTS